MTSPPAGTAGEFTVGLVQMACSPMVARNHEAAEAGVRDAASRGAQVVCLQELFATPYFCQREDAACFDLAEEIPGPLTTRFAALARALDIALVVPLFERRAAGLYHNSAVVIDASGDLLGAYRKVHVPDDPQFLEKFYFTPGDLGYRVFDTRHARIGVLICWDQWYPEAARLTALRGAEVDLLSDGAQNRPGPASPGRTQPHSPSATPGSRSSGDTRLRTASTWRPSIESGSRGLTPTA